jgi:uncharacterized protein (DUF1800 family)
MAERWTQAHVRRLFWRAGFAATQKESAAWASAGRKATLDYIVDGPKKGPALAGPEPRKDGKPLDPENEWGDDVLWWLDRMVRSRRPLEEKMTLFWHDHFATSDQDTPLMLRQNHLFRRYALGSFRALLRGVANDPAMQLFLSLADSDKKAPNENFARELCELFTLGSGYTEEDIRQAARAFTGFQSHWDDSGFLGITFEPGNHDGGVKRIFGKSGRFKPSDVLDLVLAHPRHAPFLVGALWSFFVTEPPSRATTSALAQTYRRSGLQLRPVVRQILEHPALYSRLGAPDMVKAPVVYVAGSMRQTGTYVTDDTPTWMMQGMGQELFNPPSVAGWDWGPAWMSSNSMRVRFDWANHLIREGGMKVADDTGNPKLSAADAFDQAHAAAGRPWLSGSAQTKLLTLARAARRGLPAGSEKWEVDQRVERATMVQRSLRHLMVSGPDGQLH